MVFESRQIVNGGLLRQFIGKNVSLFVTIEDCSGPTIRAKTTDNQSVRINYTETLNARPSDWIEVIGTPAGPDAIRAKEIIQFDQSEQEFDFEAHNMLVQFLNHCPDIYKKE